MADVHLPSLTKLNAMIYSRVAACSYRWSPIFDVLQLERHLQRDEA
jgi:hypothetical protein